MDGFSSSSAHTSFLMRQLSYSRRGEGEALGVTCHRLPVRWKLMGRIFIPGAGPNRKLTHTQVGPQGSSGLNKTF